ncbi:hypothetical protein RJ639_038212 [Escallonia herrerae]|uniref:Auxin efflux carrier family protein n=1 Tax=Escallonia herrerae TaxID=1293975 RepID=A0AA89B4F3_9ASTE|nr:hypothetical protein RJ639_038212 [Escallonia herrerae]
MTTTLARTAALGGCAQLADDESLRHCNMGLLDLFVAASIPVLKVLLVTALGSFIALDHINILGDDARKHVNNIVFFVFNPALVGSNLAKTITYESMAKLWFMPFNILITFIIGSGLGWVVIQLTRAPKNLRGLVVGCCAAGNLGNMLLIIIPAVCKEKGSPFGAPDVCHAYGMAYASLSMAVRSPGSSLHTVFDKQMYLGTSETISLAPPLGLELGIGAIYLWSYVYNIVRISSRASSKEVEIISSPHDSKSSSESSISQPGSCTEPLLSSTNSVGLVDKYALPCTTLDEKLQIVGFIIGLVPQIRNLLIGEAAPLRVIQDSATLLGDGAIPALTLIVGGNLLKGLRGSGIKKSLIVGIIVARYVALPLIGIVIVRGALKFGLVHSDPLYQFVLLLQFALPPAMNIGTITQLFGAGESECSVIMLWTYALASISLTLWSTFFMWLVA